MRVGDLVRYGQDLEGLQGVLGYIIGFNGDAVEIRWFNNYHEITTELPEFIEVINEAG